MSNSMIFLKTIPVSLPSFLRYLGKINLLIHSGFLFTSASAQVTLHQFETSPVTLERISLPLRELAKSQGQYIPHEYRMEKDNPSLEQQIPVVPMNLHPLPNGPDPALQKTYNTLRDLDVNVLSVWAGLTDNVDPSDNNIAVGPNHVMQMTNLTYIRIWDKSGNVLVANASVQSVTGLNDFGDPNMVYDPVADRFGFVVLNSGGSKLIVCVSQTNDPTGSYYVYSFHTPNGFPDYPKLGMWGNSYFITTNSTSPTIFALNRDSMLTGATMGQVQKFALTNFPSLNIQAASPVTFTGALLPDEVEDALMLRVGDDAWGASMDSDHIEYFKVHIDWDSVSGSSISGPYSLYTIPYNSFLCGYDALSACLKQPGTNSKLETMNGIVMDKSQYRRFDDHETIVCSHICNADGNGQAGIRWYELRKDPLNDWYIYQHSTYAPPDTGGRFMGSISINNAGAIALGYNISSSTVYPGARITGRAWCDSLNMMTATETEVLHGTYKNGSYRYGDYNGMVADPVDGSFWFTAAFNTTNLWESGVTHFTLSDNCIPLASPPVNSATADFSLIPNPSSNEVTIFFKNDTGPEVQLSVVDGIGNMILKSVIHPDLGANKAVLNVHSLADGLYVLKLQTPQHSWQQKLIIAH